MPDIKDAADLPGAFLFLSGVDLNNNKFATVAYDADIRSGTKLQDLRKTYIMNAITGKKSDPALPYHERFAPPTAIDSKVWDSGSRSYGGVFGGRATGAAKGPSSPEWPYDANNSPAIKDGIYIAYWRHSSSGKGGIHTSSVSQRFSKDAKVEYMDLYPGNSANLIPTNNTVVDFKLKSLYVDYYATFASNRDGNGKPLFDSKGNRIWGLQWDTEIIN